MTHDTQNPKTKVQTLKAKSYPPASASSAGEWRAGKLKFVCMSPGCITNLYRRQFIELLMICLLLALFLPVRARALSISPLRQTLVIDPGKSNVARLTAINDAKSVISVQGEVDAFRVDPETGRAIFGAADDAKQWISFSSAPVALQPGASVDLIFSIAVPEKAEPGGHYLGLFARTAGAGAVGLSSRLGSLLFFYVGGRAEEALTKKLFFSDHAWYWRMPAHFFLSLQNTGNIHVVPEGGLVIQNRRGERVATLPINPERKKILPRGGWRETYTLRDLSWRDIGPFTATAFVQYGATRRQLADTVSFWYVPIWLVAAVLIIFLLLIFWRWRVRAHKNNSASFL